MTRFNLRICLFFFAVIISIHSSCPKEIEGPASPPIDPLPDPIPYNELGHGKLVFLRIGPIDNNCEGVYVIDIDQQKNWGIGSGSFDSPAVSPHGQKIAFTRLASGMDTAFDVHIMDIDGANMQNVTGLQGQDRQPSWTPDSSEILYWVDATVGHCLYRQPATLYWSKQLIKIFSPGSTADQGELGSIKRGPFSVSPDLKLVFIGNLTYVGQAIITMDIDGSNIRVIKYPPPKDYEFHSPVWSPDGQKIAFLLNYKDSSYASKFLELFIMDADGSNLRSIVKFTTYATGSWSGYNDLSLCWSPDGSKIAFNKKEKGHLISHIYIINPDGSGLTQVTFAEGVTDRSLTWSN